jgi:hypothetical protein
MQHDEQGSGHDEHSEGRNAAPEYGRRDRHRVFDDLVLAAGRGLPIMT